MEIENLRRALRKSKSMEERGPGSVRAVTDGAVPKLGSEGAPPRFGARKAKSTSELEAPRLQRGDGPAPAAIASPSFAAPDDSDVLFVTVLEVRTSCRRQMAWAVPT